MGRAFGRFSRRPLFPRPDRGRNSGPDLKVEGDPGRIPAASLEDSRNMYENRGERVAEKYGTPERQAMFTGGRQ